MERKVDRDEYGDGGDDEKKIKTEMNMDII